ncbi:MAG: YCF48-related protein [Candidatus Kapaibacterium sp.]
MKNLFIILLVLTAFSVNAQWIQQYTGVTANLYDIEFLNRYTGWCVGSGGTCLKTTNGGVNWIQMNHPVGTKPIESVHIVDSNVVYFVGDFETIFKTTNGGTSWIVIKNGPSGNSDSYFGLYFINKDSGWVCGNGNKVLRTRDGGNTFDSGYVNSNWLYDMYFKGASTGFVTSQGKVYKTTDGGNTWFYSLLLTTTRIFWKLSFVEGTHGWVASYNEAAQSVYKTTNIGVNWTLICDSSAIDNMYGVEFVNKDTGFICGMYNKLFKTTDGGFHWARENTTTNNQTFLSLRFVNDTVGWICSTTGIILHTTTGGQTLTGIANQTENIADKYELRQNYPNPFNNQTKIRFEIPKYSEVRIVVFDILGKQKDIILDGIYQAGKYEINYSPKDLSSGIYFYRMKINGEITKSRKLILKK